MPRATLRVVLVCALVACAARAADPDQRINNRVAFQKALVDAEDHLKRGNYRDAVLLLEKHIAYIDGNRAYLVALRDAYVGYVAQLKASGDTAGAARAVAAWYALFGTLLVSSAYGLRRPHEAFVGYATLTCWCVLLLLLPVLHPDDVSGGAAWYVGMVALLALGIYGVLRGARGFATSA